MEWEEGSGSRDKDECKTLSLGNQEFDTITDEGNQEEELIFLLAWKFSSTQETFQIEYLFALWVGVLIKWK